MSKIQSRIDKKDLWLLLIIIVLVVVALTIIAKKYIKPTKNSDSKSNEITVQEEKTTVNQNPTTDEEKIAYLKSLENERDRIEYYCWEYFDCIKEQKYESAYNMLYPEFKENYFKTLEEYTKYIKKTYPSTFAVDYDDITRQGKIYVVRAIISDILGSKENEKAQRIVIEEKNYNDFVISFQVL